MVRSVVDFYFYAFVLVQICFCLSWILSASKSAFYILDHVNFITQHMSRRVDVWGTTYVSDSQKEQGH